MGKGHALGQLLGKTITGVITKRAAGTGSPQHQVFLLFSDGTYYEFYSIDASVALASGIDRGGIDAVKRYMKDHTRVEYEFNLFDQTDGSDRV